MNNEQNKKIIEDVKLKISISNFWKEEKIEMKNRKNKILKTGLVACAMFVSVTGIVFAKDIGNFVKNMFGFNSSEGVDTAVNNGYVADVDTKYQKAEGIDINVDSMIMDDFNFAMNFNVKLDEIYNLKDFASVDLVDLKITDENSNIVFATHNVNEYESEEEMREKGYMGAYSFLPMKQQQNEMMVSLSATGNSKAFPKSKHLTVEFTKFAGKVADNQNATWNVYEGNWKFEIDVPEEFYNRETVVYKAKSCTDKSINIDSIQTTLSNTALKIFIPEIKTDKVDYDLLHTSTPKSIYDKIALQKEYVETSDGKKFEIARKK